MTLSALHAGQNALRISTPRSFVTVTGDQVGGGAGEGVAGRARAQRTTRTSPARLVTRATGKRASGARRSQRGLAARARRSEGRPRSETEMGVPGSAPKFVAPLTESAYVPALKARIRRSGASVAGRAGSRTSSFVARSKRQR